jgi:dienelactone hydrolase
MPLHPNGVGVLVLAGSSGRVDADRARLLASTGAVTESIQWFGGPGQQPAPFEVPLEVFQARIAALAAHGDRVVVVGTSFGAEAALLVASVTPAVAAVAAFAPSQVIWAGVRPDGTQTSHWTVGGVPVPFVPLAEDWEPGSDPPAFIGHFQRSLDAVSPEQRAAATIAVERIPEVVLVAGGDDQVWPSVDAAQAIAARRLAAGRHTEVVSLAGAGHRTILPGEPEVSAGMRMARGGTPEADRALGAMAWPAVHRLLTGAAPPITG